MSRDVEHLPIIERGDDGSLVWVSGRAGGAHPDGAWSHLDLVFRSPDGRETVRRYTADGPAGPWPVERENRVRVVE